ncbi:hypothetical protein A9993_02410 [Rahnella victoriana]|uniref:hypothetical protein n=1 Tax=Rahnella victoriana TaxID=1510570 RepID=UPI000BD239EA|nr:hypothetical protein A9993_02410 [Rahnella victoriana]
MQKIGNVTSTADANGEWTNGNVAAGTPPTILDAAWLNTVQRELANVVTGGGLALDPTNDAQVLAALKALIKGGVTGVVGEARNARMSIATASATATFTADEVIVGTALGGAQYRIGNFSKTINLATTGAGGMDTGSAPVSGYAALYVIYNPVTNASALLAVNGTSVAAPNIYSGSNMPAGYTASALVSVLPTNSSGQFKVCYQFGRDIIIASVTIASATASGTTGTPVSFSTSNATPLNAKKCSGSIGVFNNNNSGGTYSSVSVTSDLNSLGLQTAAGWSSTSIGTTANFQILFTTPQMLYYSPYVTAGTSTLSVTCTGYSF